MSVINELLNEYSRMRENGLDAKASLHALRPYIEPLPDNHKAELAKSLRLYEKGELKIERDDDPVQNDGTVVMGKKPAQASTATPADATNPSPTPPPEPEKPAVNPDAPTKPAPSSIKRLSPIKPITPQSPRPGEDLMPEGLRPGATWIACPNCNTKNKANEIFCYACGHLMDSGQGYNSTRSFADADMETITPEHFGRDSLLILTLRDTGAYFKLRPQSYTHELVMGRSSSNTAMKPDVDLEEQDAEALGVSRLHLAVQYMMENNTLIVFDLGSANGSFINGQKLHPSEKRILRNGDELRLGRMIIRVTYEHPGPELD